MSMKLLSDSIADDYPGLLRALWRRTGRRGLLAALPLKLLVRLRVDLALELKARASSASSTDL